MCASPSSHAPAPAPTGMSAHVARPNKAAHAPPEVLLAWWPALLPTQHALPPRLLCRREKKSQTGAANSHMHGPTTGHLAGMLSGS
jgi:hypothetical protein